MRFALTEDQINYREAVRALLDRECPPAAVRGSWPGGNGAAAREAWRHLAEMGIVGALVPEGDDGLGLDARDLVPLLEETGRAALPLPVVETAFVAAPLLVAAGADDLLAPLLAGDLLVACGLDAGALVPYAGVANAFVLAAGDELRWLPRDEVDVEPIASIDGARALGRVVARGAGRPLATDPALIAAAWDRGALGAAAQLVGLGRRLLDLATEYAQERRQFGVPIGSFQAVKHHLADALLGLEFAAPAVLRAAHSLATGAAEAARDVAMAKALASDAAERAAAVSLQCHGAIAYTIEYDLHLYAKRVWTLSRSWGDAASQRARVATALGLASPNRG